MKRYLLVEGITDVAFVKYLCLKKGITKKFDDFKKDKSRYIFNDFIIVDLNGQDNLSTALNFLKKEINGIDKIAIIQDADDDFNQSKEKIENALKKSTIDKKRVEYFLTPNGKDKGDLETLLLSTLKDNNIIKCFNPYEKCLKQDNDIHEKALNKGKVYAYTMYSQKGKNLYKPQDSFINKKNEDTKLWNIKKDELKPFIDFILNFF